MKSYLPSNKVMRILSMLAFAAIAIVIIVLLNNYKAIMMEQRKEQARNHVMNAYELLIYYHNKAQKNELTEQQAHDYAAESIRAISPTTSKYYWINDTNSKMIMHTTIPELEGQNLHDYQGPDKQYLFRDMTAVAIEQNEGYIQYLWQKPEQKAGDDLYPKISFIKHFKPWGWIIGSGVYYEDIDNAFWHAVYVVSGIGIAVILFMWMLCLTVTESLKK